MVTSSSKFGNFLRNYNKHLKGESNTQEEKPTETPEGTPQDQLDNPSQDQPVVVPDKQPANPVSPQETPKTEEKKIETPMKDSIKKETPVKNTPKKEIPTPKDDKQDNKEGDVIEVK